MQSLPCDDFALRAMLPKVGCDWQLPAGAIFPVTFTVPSHFVGGYSVVCPDEPQTSVLRLAEELLQREPLPCRVDYEDDEEFLDACHAWCDMEGFERPCYRGLSAVRRFADAPWALRYTIVQIRRQQEETRRKARHVHKRLDQYVSNDAFEDHQLRAAMFRAFAQETRMVSSGGKTAYLSDLVDSSTANVDNRRAEMMTRLNGIEVVARDAGLVGLFLTMTVPGRMHAVRHTGLPNKAYDGSTVRDCQSLLARQWKLLGARLAKAAIAFIGMRCVEPHHDGTPHWHMLAWVQPAAKDEFLRHFREVAVMGSEGDRGAFASKHRYKVVELDDEPGRTALSYVAKYVAKNIGEGMRPTVWASWHGIRQFQFYGAGRVTVWREARRVGEPTESMVDLVEAAKGNDYAAFLWHCRQTSPELARAEPERNRFGEQVQGRVLGLDVAGGYVQTRTEAWARKGSEPKALTPWTRMNNCNPEDGAAVPGHESVEEEVYADAFDDRESEGESFDPWPADPADDDKGVWQ